MAAYYNEHDAFAAAWLRELIREGHIADGEVDTRSIVDVRPNDLRGFTQCHFFAGIGGWSYALRLAGWSDDRPVWTGSCPCQPFSSAGKQTGTDDPRHLWPTWFRLIRECRPDVVFGEQVEAAINHGWLDLVCDDLEREGYAVGAVGLPAASVGAPHIRHRLWFVADTKHAERWALSVDRQDGRDGANGGRQEAYGEPRTRGEVRGVADAASTRQDDRWRGGAGSGGGQLQPEQLCAVGWLADSGGEGTTRHTGEDGGVADADGGRFRIDGRASRYAGYVDERSENCGELEHAEQPGLERLARYGDGGHESGRQPAVTARPVTAPGWSDIEWLQCRDGKARPTQPGLFPLADGIPARVGRLRGYGNAIVPPLAAEFIKAYRGHR